MTDAAERASDSSDLAGDLTGPHWRYALSVYSTAGVPDACLFLQDSFGVDVNILLIALFSAWRGRPLSAADIASTDAAIKPWRDEVVRPLRAIRRAMKASDALRHGPQGEAVRGEVKRAELSAEQLQQAVLARIVTALPPVDAAADLSEAAKRVVRFYGGAAADAAQDAVDRAVATIVAASPPHQGPHRGPHQVEGA
jgi:uncharacterized protein (TIGR02444 family)